MLFCGYLAVSVLVNLGAICAWYHSHRGLIAGTPVLGIWRLPQPPLWLLGALLFAIVASLLANLFTSSRVAGLASIALYLAIFPGLTAFHLVHQKSSQIPLVLSILVLSSEFHSPLIYVPSPGAATSEPQWPLICIRLLLGIIYLGIGVDKMRCAGWGWTRGRALRWYLLEHYLWGGFRFAVPLLRRPTTLRALSTTTVLMQLLAPIAVIGGWVPFVHGMTALGFHLSTQIFMGIYFLPMFGPALLSSALSYPLARLIEHSPLTAQWADTLQIGAGEPPSSAAWQVLLMLLIPACQAYSHIINRHVFPFGPYRLFSYDLSEFKHIGVLLLELGDANGEYRPWQPRDYYDVRDVASFGYNVKDRSCSLSPHFEQYFMLRYWPIIQREHRDGGKSIQSIRLLSRVSAWRDDTPMGYDDYVIGTVRLREGDVAGIETIAPVHLRQHRFGPSHSPS
jgi:hypothetical protein